ncbi:MAG: hypothetical protein WB500_00145 [Rhodoplanes sp.]
MTAKIGGSSKPWTKRQTTRSSTLAAVATIAIGTVIASIAQVITRLRPSTSATAPVKGAVSAMAKELAVITALMRPALAPNSRASTGNSACGEYRLRNAQ